MANGDAAIQADVDSLFAGSVKVELLSETSPGMAPAATHYIVNAASPKSFTLPMMAEEHYLKVKVSEGSESVTFNAGVGESIDGEADGSITLHPGASAMFVKKGGVMYLM